MVEILGRDIDQKYISDNILNWQEDRKNPVREEVLDAIRVIAEELVLPTMFIEDGKLFARGSRDEDSYKKILNGFTKSEKLIARGAAFKISFMLADRVIKGEIK